MVIFPVLPGVSLVLEKLIIRARSILIKMNLVGVMISPSMLKALSEEVLVAGNGQLAFQNLANNGKSW